MNYAMFTWVLAFFVSSVSRGNFGMAVLSVPLMAYYAHRIASDSIAISVREG